MKTLKLIELIKLVEEGKATDRQCKQTGAPIFLNDGYYYINGEVYSENADVDKVVRELTEGAVNTWKEYYNEEGGDYYTTYEDEDSIIDEIIDLGLYIDEHGAEVEITIKNA